MAPTAPVPPCAGTAQPDFAEVGAPPAVGLWRADAMPPAWRPAPCTGIERQDGAVLVAVAGRFRSDLDGRALLGRLGAVSAHLTIRYWSVSQESWVPLLEQATALEGPDPEQPRADFAVDELAAGRTLHLLYDDSQPVGPIVSAISIHHADENGFTIQTRNLTAARVFGLPIAQPEDLTSYLTVEREGPGTYRYFALGSAALSMPLLPEASHINRAIAVYRYVAGIPTDQEPPAAVN